MHRHWPYSNQIPTACRADALSTNKTVSEIEGSVSFSTNRISSKAKDLYSLREAGIDLKICLLARKALIRRSTKIYEKSFSRLLCLPLRSTTVRAEQYHWFITFKWKLKRFCFLKNPTIQKKMRSSWATKQNHFYLAATRFSLTRKLWAINKTVFPDLL